MKKRVIIFALIILSVFLMSLLAACDKDNGNNDGQEPEATTYTYTFFDDDGVTVIKTETVDEGSAIVAPADPTKVATAQYTYSFSGWDKVIPETITANISFVAEYSSVVNKYDITVSNATGSGNFGYGSEVTLTFTDEIPDDKRVEWKNGEEVLGYSLTEEFTFVVTGVMDITATIVERANTEGLQFAEYGAGYKVTGYEGTSPEVFISSVYNGLPVLCIEVDCFRDKSIITSIRMPKSIGKWKYKILHCQ
jgi:hypothetical protein